MIFVLPPTKASHSRMGYIYGYWVLEAGHTVKSQMVGQCCPGKEENSTVDELIGASINNNSTAMVNGYTPCLAITFVKKPMGGNSSSEEHYVALEYAAVPCVNNITTTICEVRVYEQVILS